MKDMHSQARRVGYGIVWFVLNLCMVCAHTVYYGLTSIGRLLMRVFECGMVASILVLGYRSLVPHSGVMAIDSIPMDILGRHVMTGLWVYPVLRGMGYMVSLMCGRADDIPYPIDPSCAAGTITRRAVSSS